MRSPMTSRSNCAKDNSTLRVKRPIDVVVLNCCVTETKEEPLVSRISTILAKSASERVSRSIPVGLQSFQSLAEDLVNDDGVDPTRRDVGEQSLQSGPIHCGAGEPAVVISRAQAHPAFVALAVDEGLASFALRLQRIEFLLEPLFGRFAGIDRTASLSGRPSAIA